MAFPNPKRVGLEDPGGRWDGAGEEHEEGRVPPSPEEARQAAEREVWGFEELPF